MNELKLRFQEQLRVVGKYDLNNANNYLSKRRKFADVDIAKDFQKRTYEKDLAAKEEFIKNQKVDINSMSLVQLEEYRELQIKKEQEESDIYQKVILTDTE